MTESNQKERCLARILIVDDNPDTLRVLCEILQVEGYKPRPAISGETALKAVAVFSPELILLDVKMPGMDGYAVCEQLKSSPDTADIPIVFISAVDDAEEKVRAFAAGGADYVTKPFQIAEVLARVQSQLSLHQARVQLKKKNKALADLNKELESFTSAVSHDLSAPLRALAGFSKELVDQYGDQFDEQARRYLSYLKEGSEEMQAMIAGLLTLSRSTSGELLSHNVDLSSVAESIGLTLRRKEPERNINICIQPDMRCVGDPRLLKNLLTNLLNNAWKYTSGVSTAEIRIGECDVASQCCFYVADNGVGFDMRDKEKLFIPFQRLHSLEQFSGSGIGLATVQRIVHRHGGKIWAESAVEKGATFYFTLSANLLTHDEKL